MDQVLFPSPPTHKIPTRNYDLQQVNGQMELTHKYMSNPKKDTEVFIKKIPRDCTLEEIFDFCKTCGIVFQIRLLMDYSGFNRGYCFVKYCDVYSAKKAVCILNNMEIRSGYTVLVKSSFDNNKLVIEGVPDCYSLNEIKAELGKIVMFKNVIRLNGQIGMYFNYVVMFSSHRRAVEARKSLWPRVTLFRKEFPIDWAIPEGVRNCVKLYFSHASVFQPKSDLFEAISELIDVSSLINFFKNGTYGHIVFKNSLSATEALKILEERTFFGHKLKWSLTRLWEDEANAESIVQGDEDTIFKEPKVYFRVINGAINKAEVFLQMQELVVIRHVLDIVLCEDGSHGQLIFNNIFNATEAYKTLKFARPYAEGRILEFLKEPFPTKENIIEKQLLKLDLNNPTQHTVSENNYRPLSTINGHQVEDNGNLYSPQLLIGQDSFPSHPLDQQFYFLNVYNTQPTDELSPVYTNSDRLEHIPFNNLNKKLPVGYERRLKAFQNISNSGNQNSSVSTSSTDVDQPNNVLQTQQWTWCADPLISGRNFDGPPLFSYPMKVFQPSLLNNHQVVDFNTDNPFTLYDSGLIDDNDLTYELFCKEFNKTNSTIINNKEEN